MRVFTSTFCVILIMAGTSLAFDADRPKATASSSVVGYGVLEAGAGISYCEKEVNGQDFHEFGMFDTLVRYGLTETVEVRLGWDGYISRERSGANTDKGVGDATLGTKIFVHEESRSFGEASIIAQVNLPLGDDEFTSDEFDPSLLLAASHTLQNKFSLAYNIGVGLETALDSDGEEETVSSALYSLAIGHDCTAMIDAYLEVAGAVGLSASTDPALLATGVSVLLRDNLQADASLGVGLTDDAKDWFIGVGLSYRR
ncbi:MAG: transporter [Kiritimatiellae bacterium]|nr:transporter [Kiritimatiellia bacterium]